MADQKITFSELEAKLADIDIPDKELRKYFDSNRGFARPFQPSLQINQELVEVSAAADPRVESGIVGDFVNNIAKFRRRRRFRQDRKEHPERKVLVSEGDSWFQFPFFLEDVIDQIIASKEFNVLSAGTAGDTLQNMIHEDPEYLDALDEVGDEVVGFVFSGGGNDILGEDPDGNPVLPLIVRDFDGNLSAEEHLIATKVDEQFQFIRDSYETMIQDIRRDFPQLPIFIHGYGYVFPGRFDDTDLRDPFYADREQWVAGPLDLKGITNRQFQSEIVRHVINRLHAMQLELVNNFPNVHKIDVRSTLPDVNEWNDEIHPNDNGFVKVGNEFLRVIRSVIN